MFCHRQMEIPLNNTAGSHSITDVSKASSFFGKSFPLIHPNFDGCWSLWIKISGQLPWVVPFATGGGGSLRLSCKHSDETENSLWHRVCILTTELWSRQLMCCWQLYSCNWQPKVEVWSSGISSAETASFKSFIFSDVSVIIYIKQCILKQAGAVRQCLSQEFPACQEQRGLVP